MSRRPNTWGIRTEGRSVDPARDSLCPLASKDHDHAATSDALSVNDVEFIHIDFNNGKRVLVWRRGTPNSDRPVVVVANFSDFTSEYAGTPQGESVVHNWPSTPLGRQWKEITQDRIVPPEWVGREPIVAWEAKVYAIA